MINPLTTRSSSNSVLKKRIVYSSEFFLSSCSCGKHTSTERMRIPKIPMKEVRTDFFGCYSVCETMKDTKEGYFIVWANYKYLCNSIVGSYFEGTYDVTSVTTATRQVNKKAL